MTGRITCMYCDNCDATFQDKDAYLGFLCPMCHFDHIDYIEDRPIYGVVRHEPDVRMILQHAQSVAYRLERVRHWGARCQAWHMIRGSWRGDLV